MPLDPTTPRVALGIAIVCGLLAGALPVRAASARTVTRRATPAGVVCTVPIQHPISIHVTALDPIRRGQVVRLQVSLGTNTALERGEVRIVSAGDAAVAGPRRASLGLMEAGARAEHGFALRLPASGARTLVEFVVEGEGPRGTIRRGAAFNLLPDGPAEKPRVTRTGDGEAIAEVEARRLVP